MPTPPAPAPTVLTPAAGLTVRVLESIDEVPAAAWNALVAPDDPFTEHAFLHVLEATGCVGEATPWQPRHITLWRDQVLVAAMPCYLRWNSQGEFVFDHLWAEAYRRAGLSYYPKATAAVPFTPVTGRRLLLRGAATSGSAQTNTDTVGTTATIAEPDSLAATLSAAALAHFTYEEPTSGLHVLFLTEAEAALTAEAGALRRLGIQYHWLNRGYSTFADYTQNLRSKKRKQVLQEREAIAAQGIEVVRLSGHELTAAHLDAIWAFYQNTGARKWGTPYLNRAWFDAIVAAMPERILAVLARRDGAWIGGTFNFIKGDAIYGRYWGTLERAESLHFECCYYQLIEHAIACGAKRVEAGAQGEHKFLRGYEPVLTHSVHWIRHPLGRDAIAQFLANEREHTLYRLQRLRELSPLKPVRSAATSTPPEA